MRLVLSNDITKNVQLTAELIRLNPSQRMQLSLKKLGICLGLGVVSVFIPVLHFFLVPLFLVLSIILPIKTYGKEFRLVLKKPEGCLECAKPLKEEVALDEALRVKCPHCSANYILQP